MKKETIRFADEDFIRNQITKIREASEEDAFFASSTLREYMYCLGERNAAASMEKTARLLSVFDEN